MVFGGERIGRGVGLEFCCLEGSLIIVFVRCVVYLLWCIYVGEIKVFIGNIWFLVF